MLVIQLRNKIEALAMQRSAALEALVEQGNLRREGGGGPQPKGETPAPRARAPSIGHHLQTTLAAVPLLHDRREPAVAAKYSSAACQSNDCGNKSANAHG